MSKSVKTTIISFFCWLLLKLLYLSYRFSMEVDENSSVSTRNPMILAFWHCDQVAMPEIYRWGAKNFGPWDIFVLISAHQDGRIAAETIQRFGIKSVAGSSSKGGSEALQKLVKLVKTGGTAAFTPDGPRGPRFEAKAGVISLAHKTGAPIIPIAIHADKKWTFNSWDKMFLPKPFSKVIIKVGPDIFVPQELGEQGFEKCLEQLAETLMDLRS